MFLQPGARLGPYEIVSLLGAGGMGEVYRARDPRLGRDVAIKVLPAAYSTSVDRLHRFEQEARAAAALAHPNILAVYDIGTADAAPYIVSELLEGETLRDRLRAGPLGARKAIQLALPIAHGLAAAHEKGITHRDLKPENVFITSDNRVKILDFGLAKLTQDQSVAGSTLATVPSPTEPGVMLGTVGYMAPEQVRGLPVDHRADLFAFGAILYELVSGRRAFSRDTGPETMASILNDDPPELGDGVAAIPPDLVRIVNRCLEKTPAARFQNAGDLAFALHGLSDVSSTSKAMPFARPRAGVRTSWIGGAIVALLLAVLTPIAYQHFRERRPMPDRMRFNVAPTVEFAPPGNFSVSPDGRHIAFAGRGPDGIARLWIRSLDSLEARPLPGSELTGVTPPPFWSPDSRFIAFDAGGRLKKLELSGGLPQTLCETPSVAVGGSWNRNGDIIFGNIVGGLLRVRETGGDAIPVTVLDRSRNEEFHLLPSFLPDGRHFVYLRVSPTAPEAGGTFIGTLDAKPEEQSAQRLMPYAVGLTFVAPRDGDRGRLLFLREGALMSQPFDAERLALAGDPVPVVERVGSFRDGAYFAVSDNDTLVYRTAESDYQLTWFDRQGSVAGQISEPGGYREVALSPDGTRAAASRTDPQDSTKADLWLFDLSRGAGATRLTLGAGIAEFPVWSPDGKRIVYTFNHSRIHQKLASGGSDETELVRANSAELLRSNSFSPDGRFFLYSGGFATTRSLDLLVLRSDDSKPVPFIATSFSEEQGRFSPNGRWVAYASNESGQSEIYVREFATDFGPGSANSAGSVLVSRGGGTAPRWRGDGREMFYLAANGKMMAVDVNTGPEFHAGLPTPLFQTPPGTTVGDVTSDGKRFLLVTPPSASTPFIVVLNWTAALKK